MLWWIWRNEYRGISAPVCLDTSALCFTLWGSVVQDLCCISPLALFIPYWSCFSVVVFSPSEWHSCSVCPCPFWHCTAAPVNLLCWCFINLCCSYGGFIVWGGNALSCCWTWLAFCCMLHSSLLAWSRDWLALHWLLLLVTMVKIGSQVSKQISALTKHKNSIQGEVH